MTTGKRHIPINNHGPSGNGPAGNGQATEGSADPRTAAAPPRAAEGAPAGGRGPGGGQPGGAHRGAAATKDPAAQQAAAAAAAQAALEEKCAAVQGERDALADSLLRLRAEFDNFRRRATREMVDSRSQAQGELLMQLLPVLDNLDRALDAAEHHEEGKVLGGVRMTRDMFVALLGRAGVQEVEGVGAPFDPQIHDAVLVQPSEVEEGAVVAVLERGYRLGDRILRPAKVIVSAGQPQQA